MRETDYRHTGFVMIGLAAATLTGFLRQAALAHQLGAGRAADIYLVAFAVPEFVFVALPIVLSPAFIPLFAETRQERGEHAAWRFGMHVAAVLLAVLFLVTVLGELATPLIVRWLSPGFDGAQHARAVRTARPMLLGISLMGLATLAGAALQVYRHFGRPSLATGVYNLVFIAILLVVPLGRPLDRAAWGVMLGAAGALVLQLPFLWRYRPAGELPGLDTPSDRSRAFDRRADRSGRLTDPAERLGAFVRLVGPLLAGYTVHHLILFVDRGMATALGAGKVAALSYAYHLALVVGQLSGLAVSTAVFPSLAEEIATGDKAGARADLSDALSFVWVVGLPAACGLILLRTPMVSLLFEHGAFGRAATTAVSGPLRWYALAVLADALCQPLWRAVYAHRSPWIVVAVNALQTGLRWAANVALIPLVGYNGLAISALVGLSVQAVVLGWLVRRWVGAYLSSTWWRDATRVVLAAAVAAVLTLQLVHVGPGGLGQTSALLKLVVGGVVGGTAYLISLWVLNYRRRAWFEHWTNRL